MASEADAAGRAFAFVTAVAVVLIAVTTVVRLWADDSNELFRRLDASATLWPASLQLYTDSVDREFVVLYRLQDGTLRPLTAPVADRGNRRGLGHSGYAQLGRLADTVATIPPGAWQRCDAASVDACATVVATAPRATAVSAWPGVSGPVVFAVERPTASADGSGRRITEVAAVDLVQPS